MITNDGRVVILSGAKNPRILFEAQRSPIDENALNHYIFKKFSISLFPFAVNTLSG
jgi:hypothetical protein